MDLKVDKQNKECCYNDKEHKYWNSTNNKSYISVTTLIHKFQNEFDSDFWSSYKAFEALVKTDAKSAKEKLRKTKKFNNDLLVEFDISENEFNGKKQDILDEWDKTKNDSCVRGTGIHAEKENVYYTKKEHNLSSFGLGGKFKCKKDHYELDLDKGVYPEYLVHYQTPDGILRIAGQIDLLIKDGNEIICVDYKTNREIKKTSFFDSKTKKNQKMLYPLNNLMDCNYYHYTLQLSLYAWMIERINPEFKVKGLILIHYDHSGNTTTYQLDYLKDDVMRMLKFYKNQIKIDYENSLLTPIVY